MRKKEEIPVSKNKNPKKQPLQESETNQQSTSQARPATGNNTGGAQSYVT